MQVEERAGIRQTEIVIDGKTIVVKTGRMAKQSGCAVEISCGETMVLVTATESKKVRDGIDYFPLLVDYEEKLYSVGRIPGSFGRREGKAPDKCILTSRLIDRPIRPLFKEGYVSVQDVSAQQLLDFIEIKDEFRILDACSAPGGKACQILENNNVDIIALDIDQKRLAKVKENIDRLELNANLICADATNLNWWDSKPFDMIIADVPCSASGTIKRNPDIKFHRKLKDIKNFVNLQQKIVVNLWNILKPGGKLVYITCSIFKEENELNIDFFKKKLKNIKVNKEINILPTESQDGFFYSILEKNIN